MEQQRKEMRSVFGTSTSSFDSSPVSRSRNGSIRYLNQRTLRPETFTQNPYQETIDSLFSRLSFSHHDSQPRFPVSDGNMFTESILDIQNMRQNLHNNITSMGLRDFVALRDYMSYPANTDCWDSFKSVSLQSPDINGLSRANSRGFTNPSMSKSQNSLGPSLYNSPRPSLYSRSPHWLHEPSNSLPLEYLKGRIVSLAKDQNGCRLLQRTLGIVPKKEIDMVFYEMIDHVGDLMLDPFGNYVVQKLVEACNEEQRTRILLSVTKNEFQLVRICLNIHGTRAVQKMLQHISSQQQVNVVMSALSPGAVPLAKDMNGHHVIKRCLEHFSDEDNKYLLNVVADNCFEIATDKSGCCVLQQCVECSHGEPRDRLVAEIISNALLLAEDRYGNYVVQHLLGLRVSQITAKILGQLEGSYAALACNKYGSNVVEKFFSESREEQYTLIIWELLRNSNASMLLVDPFGNYVIQSALSASKGPVQRALIELIQLNIPRMRSNIYGKKVLAWLHRERLLYL